LQLADLDQPVVGIGKVPRCRDFADSKCKTIRYAMYNATDDEDTIRVLDDIVNRVRLGKMRVVKKRASAAS